MQLKRIHLANFQSIRGPVTIDLAPLTLLYGPNSAGKSAVADAIDLASEILVSTGSLDHAQKWLHRRDSSQRMVLGFGGSQHWEVEHTLRMLELSRLVGAPIGVYADSGLQLPLHVAERLFWERPYEAAGEGHAGREECELDVTVELAFRSGVPTLDTVSIVVDGAMLATLSRAGHEVTVALDHPKFCKANALLSEKRELGKLANDVRGLLPEAHRDLVQWTDSRLRVSALFSPIVQLGLADGFTTGLPGLEQTGTWISVPEYSDDNLSSLLLDELYGAGKDLTAVNRLREFLCGLILIPARIVGATARRMLRLGPLREVPSASDLAGWGRASASDVSEQPMRSDWVRGRSAWFELTRDKQVPTWPTETDTHPEEPLVQVVNEWLTPVQRLNMGYELRVVRYSTVFESGQAPVDLPAGYPKDGVRQSAVYLWDRTLQLPVAPDDVGTGVAQVVPVLAALASESLSFIEQPELHLHPRLQAQLADFVISRVQLAQRLERTFLCLIETHSEHLALRVLRRIRDTARSDVHHRDCSLTPSDVAFYYFEPRDGETQVHHIRVDLQGRFVDRWPRGFFDERSEDLFDDAD
ncbi:MAG: DUF3696 domain-containing protein [Steroidobacteraceae bacterium]